jgi:two-component system sensor histidine kinase QseC
MHHSLQRRLLVSLLLSVGLSLAAFQIVVDQLVDRYIERSFAAGVDVAQRDRLLQEIDFVLLGGVATVLGVCALATTLAVRRGLQPLEQLAGAAQDVSVDRPAKALPLTGVPVEIKPLGDRFNQLIERLANALEDERRFAASLAHELRTPVAEIRALGEAGLARHDVEGLHEFLRQSTASAIGMQGVIESLLAVARADQVAVQRALEPMGLAAAVRRLIARLRITDPENYSRLVSRVPEAIWIQTDPRLFDAMLLNLLVNAAQHGDPRSPIEIDWLLPDGARAQGTLRVRNAAPSLVPQDLSRLGERFGAHSGGEKPVGLASTGLGLWVVGRLCTVFQLSVGLDLDDQRRLSVAVSGFRPL